MKKNLLNNQNQKNLLKQEITDFFLFKNKKIEYNSMSNLDLKKYLKIKNNNKIKNIQNHNYFFSLYDFKNTEPLNYTNIIYLDFRLKNIRISFLKKNGEPIFTLTTGNFGFKKHDRKNAFSARKLIINFFKTKEVKNIGKFFLYINGFGIHRQFFFKKFYKIERLKKKCGAIIDLSKLPHNGCRGKKYRRI